MNYLKNLYLKIIYKVLASYARKVIRKYNPFIIGITGSVGKTSTKEAVYKVLHDAFGNEVWKNEGNLNAEIGIPLTILGYKKLPNKFFWPLFLIGAYFRSHIEKYPKYLVVEMGIEKPGDMKYFSTIIHPNIAILTSASAAHIENFKTISDYQKEKISLVSYLKKDGTAICNHDDEVLEKIKGDNVSFVSVEDPEGNYHAEAIKVSLEGTEFRIVCLGHKISIKSKMLGKQMVYSSVFAFAVADKLGLPLIQTGKSLENIEPVLGRMNVLEGINGITIIDDTYNANPSSVVAAIDTFEELKEQRRKVLILGNMNELGSIEKDEHKKVAEYARGKFDLVVFVGKNGKLMFDTFGDNTTSLYFETTEKLLSNLASFVHKDDIILMKASQNGNYLEEAVKCLLPKSSDPKKILVRQSNEWLRKKRFKSL